MSLRPMDSATDVGSETECECRLGQGGGFAKWRRETQE